MSGSSGASTLTLTEFITAIASQIGNDEFITIENALSIATAAQTAASAAETLAQSFAAQATLASAQAASYVSEATSIAAELTSLAEDGFLVIENYGTSIGTAATLNVQGGATISMSGTTLEFEGGGGGGGGGSGTIGVTINGTLYQTLVAGTNVTLTGSGAAATLSASGGGGGGGGSGETSPSSIAYRYFQFRFCNTWDTSYGALSIAEIEGFATIGGSTNIFASINSEGASNSWGYSYGAVTTVTSQPSSLALDGNLSTFWGTPAGNASATIVLDLGSGNSSVLAQFGLTPRASPYYYQFPFEIDVYGSNDESSWSHLGNFIGANPSSQTVQLFTIPASP